MLNEPINIGKIQSCVEEKTKFKQITQDLVNKHCSILNFVAGDFSMNLYINHYEDNSNSFFCYVRYHNIIPNYKPMIQLEDKEIIPVLYIKGRINIETVVEEINDYFKSLDREITKLVMIRRDWKRL